MYVIVNFSFNYFILFNIIIGGISATSCPIPSPLSKLRFLVPMTKSNIAILHGWVEIDCCVDGFSSLKWSFRHSLKDNWSDTLPKVHKISAERTNLQIQSFSPENSGYYKCNASDDQMNWVSNMTELQLGCTGINSDMKIHDIVQKTDFFEHDQCQICCRMSTHDSFAPINALWTFEATASNYSWSIPLFGITKNESSPLPSNRGQVWSRTDENVTTCKGKSITLVTTCTEFTDIFVNDTGTYKCFFQKVEDIRSYEIGVTVSKKVNYSMVYLGSIFIPWVLIIAVIGVVWYFYYDVILAIRWRRSTCTNSMKYDLLIVYGDEGSTDLLIASIIANDISKYGMTAYVYDRDKQYGATVHEDCLSAILQSSAVLFLLSPTSITNSNFLFCFKNCTRKKLYAFYPTRKKILRHLYLNKEESSVYEIVLASRDYYIWKKTFIQRSLLRKRFIKWILIHLPKPKIMTQTSDAKEIICTK